MDSRRQRLREPLDLVNSGARINCRNRIGRRLFHDWSLKMLLSAPWRSTATMVPGQQDGKLTEITSSQESSEGDCSQQMRRERKLAPAILDIGELVALDPLGQRTQD